MTAPAWPFPENHSIGTPKAISETVHSDGDYVAQIRKAFGYKGEGPFNADDAAIVSAWHRSRGMGDRSTITKSDWEMLVHDDVIEEKPDEPSSSSLSPEEEGSKPAKKAAAKKATSRRTRKA